MAPRSVWGTPGQTIKIKRGGGSATSNNGPVGRKARPAARLQRTLADTAAGVGVIDGVKRSVALAALAARRKELGQDERTGSRR